MHERLRQAVRCGVPFLGLALAASVTAGPPPRVRVLPACAAGTPAADCARRIEADVPGPDGRWHRLTGPFPEPAREVPPDERLRRVDLDFDGVDDVALCTGREALAGTPSYAIHRWQPAQRRYVFDARLSALQSGGFGFFTVDADRRRLLREAHGGSGWEKSEYGWIDDRPVPMLQRRLDASRLAETGWLTLVRGERIDGRWIERRWHVAPDAPPPRAFDAPPR